MPNPAKVQKVAELTELFKGAPAVAVTDFMGLTVAQMTELRKDLREAEITYLVAKNTLLRLAAKDAGQEQINEFLEGPTAIAFASSDPGRMAKLLYDYGKKNEKPAIKALVIDDVLYTGEETERIAKLPSRQDLLAMVVGSVTAPLQNFVGTLDGIIRELVGTVEAMKEKIDS